MKLITGPLVGAAVGGALKMLSEEGLTHTGTIYTGAHLRPTQDGLFLEFELVLEHEG